METKAARIARLESEENDRAKAEALRLNPAAPPSLAEQVAQGRGYSGGEPKQFTEVAPVVPAEVPEFPKEVEPTSRVGTPESRSFVPQPVKPEIAEAIPAARPVPDFDPKFDDKQ